MEFFCFEHLMYIAISLIITVAFLIFFQKTVKRQTGKEIVLSTIALVTVFLHWSLMYYNFFKFGFSEAYDDVLFPIYPCNVAMYLLVVLAFFKNKQGRAFRYIAVFTAILGIAGNISGLIFPTYLLDKESFWDFSLLKSMVSHSTMMLGCIYLFTSKMIKVEYKNLLIFAVGLGIFFIIGSVLNWAFVASGLPNPNAWFLDRSPVDSLPFLKWYVILGIVYVLAVLFTAITIFFINKTKLKNKEGVTKE